MNRTPVISLGGGVQSTTLALMAAEGRFGVMPDLAIFADTGWEPTAVYDHLDWLTRKLAGRITVERCSAGNLRDDALVAVEGGGRFASMPLHVLNRDRQKGQLRRQCTKEYKLAPIRRHLRSRMLDHVQIWLGISFDEVQRVKPSGLTWIENAYPLIDLRMTRSDCLSWLASRGYPQPPKSACVGCPFMNNARWLDMRENHPEEWADAVDVDARLRHLPRVDGGTFLHAQLVPLVNVILEREDTGQLNFDAECEGFCGV